jgi:hypothetical protein
MKNNLVTPFKASIAPLKQSFPSRVNESTNVPKNKAAPQLKKQQIA